jgi:hypothetical protein
MLDRIVRRHFLKVIGADARRRGAPTSPGWVAPLRVAGRFRIERVDVADASFFE